MPSIDAFLASHQTGIAQLAIKYCAAMVDDPAARTAFFGPGLDVSGSGAAAFGTQAGKNLAIDPLLAKVVGSALASQPQDADVRAEVSTLMDKLILTGANAAIITKAACASVLGSGALAVQ